MRAARCEEYGSPDGVVIRDIPAPVVIPGHVVVDVAVAAVNYPDLLLIANRYQVSAPLPFTLGSEFAGRVAAVADGVTGLSAGDLVYGTVLTGAMAEQVLVPARAVAPVPPGLSLIEAAAFRVTYLTPTTRWSAPGNCGRGSGWRSSGRPGASGRPRSTSRSGWAPG